MLNLKLNLDDLFQYKKKCDLNVLNSYNKVLERAHTRIKTTSRQKNNEQCCWFVVPEVMIGVPKYDVASCIAFVIDKLKEIVPIWKKEYFSDGYEWIGQSTGN